MGFKKEGHRSGLTEEGKKAHEKARKAEIFKATEETRVYAATHNLPYPVENMDDVETWKKHTMEKHKAELDLFPEIAEHAEKHKIRDSKPKKLFQ